MPTPPSGPRPGARLALLGTLLTLSCGPTSTAPCTSDQQCQDGVFCNGTERCAPGGPGADAKGCVPSVFTCPTGLVCSERLQACRATCTSDGDCSDGLGCNGGELCRPGDAAADAMGCKPGAPLCMGPVCREARVIEFAPGLTRVVPAGCEIPGTGGCPDADGDGDRAAFCGGGDCVDNRADVNPGMRELCDAAELDEDCDPCTVGEVTPSATGGNGDVDGDGYPARTCRNLLRANGPLSQGNALCGRSGQPLEPDGGLTRLMPVEVLRPAGSAAYTQGRDCDDRRFEVNPNASEVCNGLDDNCDGRADEGVMRSFFRDGDLDGHGAGLPVERCELASGFSVLGNDCDDANPAIRPGALVCGPMATSADAVRICQSDGGWVDDACTVQRSCVPQPNGTGVCQ